MCGRYGLTHDGDTLQLELGARWRGAPLRQARYNIAPTQHAPVLLDEEGERVLSLFRWGLIPSWAKDPSIGNRLINARAETAAEKPAFRSAFKRHRCLVPASGFYEWQKTSDGKVPHWVHAEDDGLLTLAGLWECWRPKGAEPIHSFAILTTKPNAFMARIHDRMPVIVSPEDRERWLDPDAEADELQPLLRPYREGGLAEHAVSRLVNSPGNDLPELIDPLA